MMSELRVNGGSQSCGRSSQRPLAAHGRPLPAANAVVWTRRCRSVPRRGHLGAVGRLRLQYMRLWPPTPPHASTHAKLSTILSVVACSSVESAHLPHDHDPSSPASQSPPPSRNLWVRWQSNAAEMRAQVAKLGLAAVLAYGLFDGITYTTFFVLAFLGYEKSTGKNPAANIQALLGIVILMWTGNNVTRPLRVAGAAALAPVVDKALQKIQKALNLPSQVFAFMVVVSAFAGLCLSTVGLLILSRWGK